MTPGNICPTLYAATLGRPGSPAQLDKDPPESSFRVFQCLREAA